MRFTVAVLCSVGFFVASPAFADDCEADCPQGQVKASYLDGSHVTCQCVEPGAAMVDNPADGNPPSGGVGQEE
jgi:hypothetical protein